MQGSIDSSGFVVLEGETLRLNRGPLNRVAAEVKNLADAEQRWVREAVHEQQQALGVSFDGSDWFCQPGLAPFDHLIWPHPSY